MIVHCNIYLLIHRAYQAFRSTGNWDKLNSNEQLCNDYRKKIDDNKESKKNGGINLSGENEHSSTTKNHKRVNNMKTPPSSKPTKNSITTSAKRSQPIAKSMPNSSKIMNNLEQQQPPVSTEPALSKRKGRKRISTDEENDLEAFHFASSMNDDNDGQTIEPKTTTSHGEPSTKTDTLLDEKAMQALVSQLLAHPELLAKINKQPPATPQKIATPTVPLPAPVNVDHAAHRSGMLNPGGVYQFPSIGGIPGCSGGGYPFPHSFVPAGYQDTYNIPPANPYSGFLSHPGMFPVPPLTPCSRSQQQSPSPPSSPETMMLLNQYNHLSNVASIERQQQQMTNAQVYTAALRRRKKYSKSQ